jgi:hypothetical protein
LMDGTAGCGISNLFARQDHVHPKDTTKLFLSGGTMTGTLNGTIMCASSCLCSPIVCATTKVQSPIITGSTCSIAPIILGTTCVSGAITCGTTCVQTALLCSTGQVKGTIITGSTCVTSPTVCAGTCLCSIGTSRLGGAVTAASTLNVSGVTRFATTVCLVGTPAAGDISADSTLFWSPTTKAIEAFKLTGGSDSYFYCECTTNPTTTNTTCTKLYGYCPTTLAGRYQVEFSAHYGNSGANNCMLAKIMVDNAQQGGILQVRSNTANQISSAELSRDFTFSAALHCFDIYVWGNGGTSCLPYGMVRVKRIG